MTATPETPGMTATPETPAAPAAEPTGGPAESPWYAGATEDNQTFLAERSLTESPDPLIDGYRGLLKLRGVPADRLLTLPDGQADANAWREQVWGKLGMPAEASGYELDGLGETIDPEFGQAFAAKAHELGMPKAWAQEIVRWYNQTGTELAAAQQRRQSEEARERSEAELLDLKRSWGESYESGIQAGKRAMHRLEISNETVDALEQVMGTKATLTFFRRLGESIGEHRQPVPNEGAPDFFENTVESAKQKISELLADEKFQKDYQAQAPYAVERMGRLFKIAYPEG